MENNKNNTNIVISVVVICLVGLGLYYMATKEDINEIDNMQTVNLSDNKQEEIINNNPTEQKSETINIDMDTNTRLLTGFTAVSKVDTLQKVDTVVGTGAEVKAGDTVSVHYIGAIASTGEVFQSSKDFGTTPITFPLGNVIKGWTDGIPGMKIGGTRRLLIPSEQAYGANPDPRSGIPPNADLVFDVELVAIK